MIGTTEMTYDEIKNLEAGDALDLLIDAMVFVNSDKQYKVVRYSQQGHIAGCLGRECVRRRPTVFSTRS